MLGALYNLAQSKGLLEDPNFTTARVDYFLRIDGEGRFLGLVPTADAEGRSLERPVPRPPKRAVKVVSGFLFDNAKYVLGLGEKDDDENRERTLERNRQCVAAFREVVDAAATNTGDVGLLALSRFLAKLPEHVEEIAKQKTEWSGSETIAPALDEDGMSPIFERPAARAEWARQRASGSDEGLAARCLVTGQIGTMARLHNSVKRVPNASTMGAALVSFNAPAFTSYGLAQGENAPVSRAAAEGYVTALNWLLERHGERRFRSGVALGDDAVTVFWTREPSAAADTFLDLFAPDSTSAERLLEAPLKGLAPSLDDPKEFYAATLSGNAARVVVRDWFVTTVADVKRNVLRYFSDLYLGTSDELTPQPLWLLVKALSSPGGDAPPHLLTQLFTAALRGRAFPRQVLSLALERLRVPSKDKQDDRALLRARVGLIKATLLRFPNLRPNQVEVTVSLDETNKNTPYLLGRLFAVLERLQGAAQGKINSTIRDRYFGSASANPAVVFPRLLQLSVHHASKAEGVGAWLERKKGEIIAGLPAERLPLTLSLEDRGLFAIGYYHQREAFFAPKDSNGNGTQEGGSDE